jgi:DNA-binding PadR family transcriptional regulator
MKNLSKAEEMILLAIWRLKENAYGVTIRKKILETAGKDYTYGTLYGLLEQLVNKEYVVRIKGEPTHERGGRSKTFYKLTPFAIQALKDAIRTHNLVWLGITEFSFDEVPSQ